MRFLQGKPGVIYPAKEGSGWVLSRNGNNTRDP